MKWNIGIRQKHLQLFVEYRVAVKLSNILMLSYANTNFVTYLIFYRFFRKFAFSYVFKTLS